MKVVIDIPKKLYEECKIKSKSHIGSCTTIANGIPLERVIEDIKAEIDDLDVSDLGKMGIITAIFEIIDKYISRKENE